MRVAVDATVLGAAVSPHGAGALTAHVGLLAGNQLFLATVSAIELRQGAYFADWPSARREQLERVIGSTTVVPVTDALLSRTGRLREACRGAGHVLAERDRANELWIAATALHLDAPLLTADERFAGTPGLRLLP